MATHSYVEFVDDIDGSTTEDVQTRRFSLDGTEYEIDLNKANSERLDEAMAEFVGHARCTHRARGRKPGRKLASVPEPEPEAAPDPRVVREWALANGYEVSNRGRVPASVLKDYLAAAS